MEKRNVRGTEVIHIDPADPDMDGIRYAASILRNGGLVAFPTETVYGLGANALLGSAIRKVYRAKGRPSDNPLIVHIADREALSSVAREVPEIAIELMRRFWPGPLTLVLPRNQAIPDEVTGGLDTVAVRMPDHDIALALIGESGVPVAAPSANLSGRPSPTCAEHVIADLAGAIDVILDGGNTQIGLESTVLDVTVAPPVILRPGGITPEEIREVVPEVALAAARADGPVKSPGLKYKHYAPKAKVMVFAQSGGGAFEKLAASARRLAEEGLRVGIMATSENAPRYQDLDASLKVMGPQDRPGIIASRVFALLRAFDDENVDVILVEGVPEQGLGFAIMNRLVKAAGGTVIS